MGSHQDMPVYFSASHPVGYNKLEGEAQTIDSMSRFYKILPFIIRYITDKSRNQVTGPGNARLTGISAGRKLPAQIF